MNCAELEALLCDYVDETLPPGRKTEVERHLAGCPGCGELARDAAAAVAFMCRVAPVEPPAELVTKILYSLPAARNAQARHSRGLSRLLGQLLQPMLQPRVAMGFAMTILSFSMLGRFAGISPRQLTADDLNPVKIWRVLDNRVHRAWDRSVKFYESLRLVYEIQTSLGEWAQEDQQRSAAAAEEKAGSPGSKSGGTSGAQPRRE
jgi:anti-sigma factor RsiW